MSIDVKTTLSYKWAVALMAMRLLSFGTDSEAATLLYWTQMNDNTIWVANIDGSGATRIANHLTAPVTGPKGVAIDVAGGKIYWSNSSLCNQGACQTIARMNLDATNPEIIIDLKGSHSGFGTFLQEIALDPLGGKVYWGNLIDKLLRSSLDGSSTTVVQSNRYFRGVALDDQSGRIYWADPVLLTVS